MMSVVKRWSVWPVLRRWRRDTRGTSMVTTALTLPVLLVIVIGFWWLYLMISIKQSLHHGVLDAANYISDQARYWNIDPSGKSGVVTQVEGIEGDQVLPADFYDQEARRVITNRLRDLYYYSHDELTGITNTLTVTVTEPALAFAPGSDMTVTVPVGFVGGLCDPKADEEGEYRHPHNVRFRIYAEFEVPAFWMVRIPLMDPIRITLRDRATGYVQCPRWTGKGNVDKSKVYAQEGPYMVYRTTATPYRPTVTPYPTNTPPPPTETPPPTATP
jgi:hypothetical protein